ncbi:molybdate ABC transporter substrate-binding protein [Ectothiorhodospira shaposhnikovii]|uniref:molybdate ABC transporter substrate-binding protein n=1 Tax=Ectothiorhodospira shaposhnikovii TaxID=1054 RepID=UPI001903449C|nr:molybdate ABC transporter substrate-binding protein [Ectothiorhodospira shaposhnikovii]MBK1673661.1 molybdate ABC transporter substrate-binding protein [Ectothiorhodospira shaposhnikovii]MCG5512513.1 molybdate ABC transporter substrate-binding protein [Ectothiorhodospira shaposhnikovii]
MKPRHVILFLFLLFTSITTASAAELRAAVAANFLGTLQTLTAAYEAETGHKINLSAGASGALYAQVVNGAPFDLFFSADTLRAETLVADGLALEDSRFTYAVGVPVLWSSREGYLNDPETLLRSGSYRFLSIADPRNAPYGVAARQILTGMGIWESLDRAGRLVRAQSIGQAYSQIASGAAELGFVALAQVKADDGTIPGSHWIPPAEWFDPIEQQAVILKRAVDMEVARDFMAWIRSPEAVRVIEAAGYSIP